MRNKLLHNRTFQAQAKRTLMVNSLDTEMAVSIRHQKLREELDRIVNILIKEYAPDKIILFGSLAQNKLHEWSDIDLVIIKQTKEDFLDRLYLVTQLTQPTVGVEFLVYTPDEFDSMIKERNYFIKDEILAKGKILYERKK